MLGVVIGDIVGSFFEYEGGQNKTKDFSLFNADSFFTDDSVLTVAIGKALMECNGNYSSLSELALKYLKEYGLKYPLAGYGGRFTNWLFDWIDAPFNSLGNGAAMRVSAVGWVSHSIEEAKELSRKVTEVTHNHPEGIKGAEAVAVAIFLLRQGKSKEEVEQYINDNYYSMGFTLDEIRDDYRFDVTCQGSVPQALKAFFEATDFEDTIRNAVSLGGDADTQAAIACSLAEVYYEIPEVIKVQSLLYLDEFMLQSIQEFEKWVKDI